MSTILTKAKILAGKDYRETVEVPSLGGSVEIRPLTQAEYAKIEVMRTEGIVVTGKSGKGRDADVEVDISKIKEKEIEADCFAVVAGLVTGAPWTLAEVQEISPAGAVKEIAAEIYRISGVTPEGAEIADRFRKKRSGAPTAPDQPVSPVSGDDQ